MTEETSGVDYLPTPNESLQKLIRKVFACMTAGVEEYAQAVGAYTATLNQQNAEDFSTPLRTVDPNEFFVEALEIGRAHV